MFFSCLIRVIYDTVMTKSEKKLVGLVVIGGDNLPSPVGIGLIDLPNIREPVAPLISPVPASL